jgi:hypothetical protein
MPSIPDMSSSVSSLSTGSAGPGPDNPPVSESSDSSLWVAEGAGAGAVLLVFGRTSIITAEGEGTAAVLEGELEGELKAELKGYISLMSEVSISTPS